MAEPQPETPLSNNMYTALDIVGQTQLEHVGGYRDKSRLGVAMGHSGELGDWCRSNAIVAASIPQFAHE
jgi:hypothetical protein